MGKARPVRPADMLHLFTLLVVFFGITGCAPKPPPPPAKDYQFEALQNEARQVNNFIDNWSGFSQEYSRINSLEEYKAAKRKILASSSYYKLPDRHLFESKVNQFDAIVGRYEIWLDERTELLEQMEQFFIGYKNKQKQSFAKHAKPFDVGPYELTVINGYYLLKPDDPDQAYASARYVGLKQLNIIAAAKDVPLRLPRMKIGDFVVEVKIRNKSDQKILRPDGFIVHRQSKSTKAGSFIARSFREYLVSFSDEVNNKYQFARAAGVINKDSENGIRPGEEMIWSYHFNQENYPVQTVKTFQIAYPSPVFGKALKLSIPVRMISKPNLPVAFSSVRG